jgi:hypothetical protein
MAFPFFNVGAGLQIFSFVFGRTYWQGWLEFLSYSLHGIWQRYVHLLIMHQCKFSFTKKKCRFCLISRPGFLTKQISKHSFIVLALNSKNVGQWYLIISSLRLHFIWQELADFWHVLIYFKNLLGMHGLITMNTILLWAGDTVLDSSYFVCLNPYYISLKFLYFGKMLWAGSAWFFFH